MLYDQKARDCFIQDIETNFSVIAPAGVGKTKAIVDRIVHLALQDVSGTVLPRMVVVTYTKKAAEEMYIRVNQELTSKGHIGLTRHLNEAFFGTIHSFCLHLLKKWGFYIGLDQDIEVVENDDHLWRLFIAQYNQKMPLSEAQAVALKRYGVWSDCMELGRKIPLDAVVDCPGPCPEIDYAPIFSYVPNKRNEVNVNKAKQLLRRWLSSESMEILSYDKGGEAFLDIWQLTFQPLKRWVGKAMARVALDICKKYLQYRIEEKKLLYDDLIYLANTLLLNPDAKVLIAKKKYNVILDEAQDTDKRQFNILLNITLREPTALVLENLDSIDSGRFCMVGDPQQAIYGSRACVDDYKAIHQALIRQKVAKELIFEVTMRCGEAIVEYVNGIFPYILDEKKPMQVSFVSLKPKPDASKATVLQWKLEHNHLLENTIEAKEKYQAEWLAHKVVNLGKEGLGIKDWSEMALLAPRTQWLLALQKAFESLGIACQIHSTNAINGDNPAYAWLTALVGIMNNPLDSFEIVGVLREIFVISDHDIALFSREYGKNAIQILDPSIDTGTVGNVLCFLSDIYHSVRSLNVRMATQYIIDKVDLGKRLFCLPVFDRKILISILDQCCLQASKATLDGYTLGQWAEYLRAHFYKKQEILPSIQDTVQLYSCHKSKGLEWKLVLVPFVCRKISWANREYPYINHVGGQYFVAVDATQVDEKFVSNEHMGQKAELDRLMYVTSTRAKESLIIIDDKSIWGENWMSFQSMLRPV